MRIAVWNTAFLGDALLTLPLIHSLAAAYPGAEIDFWVRRGLGAFFASQPVLRAVHEVDKKRGAIGRQIKQIRATNYDIWINAHPSFRSALLARCSGAPVRIGYNSGLFSDLFSRLCHSATVRRRMGEVPEIERLLDLTRPLGIERLHSWPDIVLPPEAAQRAKKLFDLLPPCPPLASAGKNLAQRGQNPARSGKNPVIGLHPGSVWGTKRWPAEYYGRLAVMALEAGCRVLLFAGPGEEDAAQAVLAAATAQNGQRANLCLVNLAGAFDLIDLAAHIARLDCYVTNDSGPMHMAWAQHVPVTALFGPTVEELGFFPRGAKSTVLQVDRTLLPCRPCGLHGPQSCPQGHHNCMLWITPEMVWEDVRSKIF